MQLSDALSSHVRSSSCIPSTNHMEHVLQRWAMSDCRFNECILGYVEGYFSCYAHIISPVTKYGQAGCLLLFQNFSTAFKIYEEMHFVVRKKPPTLPDEDNIVGWL